MTGDDLDTGGTRSGDDTERPSCDCYECVGPRYADDGETILNNMKHHTLGEPCENCGRGKSEYLDLGRKGYYVCWWCNDRAGGDVQ